MATTFRGNGSLGTLMAYIDQMDNRLSDRTKQEYSTRLKEIAKNLRHTGDTVTPDMLVDHVRNLVVSGQIASSTYRSYKSAITFWIGQQTRSVIAGGGNPSNYARAYDSLQSFKYSQTAPASRLASSKKLKFFDSECLDALIKYSKEKGTRAPSAAKAAAFAKANLLVGLRPSEWFSARLASRLSTNSKGLFIRDSQGRLKFDNMLIVDNAKATRCRRNGHQRELVLHGISANEMTAIVFFLRMARSENERYPTDMDAKTRSNLFYRPMNNVIQRALLSIGIAKNDIPSIYSTRHQAVADFKASGVDKREIAAFFGHSSDYTHAGHFAPKKHGGRNVLFRPSPECMSRMDIKNVTKQHETIPHRMATEVENWIKERDSRNAPIFV